MNETVLRSGHPVGGVIRHFLCCQGVIPETDLCQFAVHIESAAAVICSQSGGLCSHRPFFFKPEISQRFFSHQLPVDIGLYRVVFPVTDNGDQHPLAGTDVNFRLVIAPVEFTASQGSSVASALPVPERVVRVHLHRPAQGSAAIISQNNLPAVFSRLQLRPHFHSFRHFHSLGKLSILPAVRIKCQSFLRGIANDLLCFRKFFLLLQSRKL